MEHVRCRGHRWSDEALGERQIRERNQQGYTEERIYLRGVGGRQDFLPQHSNSGIAARRDSAGAVGAGGQVKRRNFVRASAGAVMAASAEAEAENPKNQIFHLLYFYMRTGSQVERT